MKRKKPNYKLRRKIAKIIVVLIILIPIFLINKTKILNAPLYITNIKYTKNEAKNTINYLKEKNKINDNTANYILKINNLGYSNNVVDYVIRNLNKTQITDFLSRKYSKNFEKYIKCKSCFYYNA